MIKLFDQNFVYLAEWDSQWRCLLAAVLHRHCSDLTDARCDVAYVSSFSNWTKPKKKLWICKMWEGHYMHVEREREIGDLWTRSALWIWGCERWSVSLRSAFAIVFVVVVADWVCAERVTEREREREEVKEEAKVRWFLVFIFWGGVLAGGTSERELKFQAFIARVSFLFFLLLIFCLIAKNTLLALRVYNIFSVLCYWPLSYHKWYIWSFHQLGAIVYYK